MGSAIDLEPNATQRQAVAIGVLIPKEISDQIGIKPGDEVTFEPDGSEVRVRRIDVWPETGGGTEELLEERRRERDAEERKAQRWGVDRPR